MDPGCKVGKHHPYPKHSLYDIIFYYIQKEITPTILIGVIAGQEAGL